MSVNDKMTSIADEIRQKTNLTDKLTLEQMVIDIASIHSGLGDVPSYVEEEAQRVADVVSKLQNENTLTFIALSDIHYSGSERSTASTTHAVQGAKLISDSIPVNFTAILGDTPNGAEYDTQETHLTNLLEIRRILAILQPDIELPGNHDYNGYNSNGVVTTQQLYSYMGRFSKNVTKPQNEWDRNYFYWDLETKKVRVICLNTADTKDIPVEDVNQSEYISAVQFQWLIDTLDMTDKEDWQILILSHHPIHWYANSMVQLLSLLDAYVEGSSGSFNVDSLDIGYDFNGKNSAKLVGCFHGHTHNFIHGKAGNNKIARVGIPNVLPSGNNRSPRTYEDFEPEFAKKYVDKFTYNKVDNTAKDTALCVCVVDLEKEIINAVCYGAGFDRIISYGDKSYTITSCFNNVHTDVLEPRSVESNSAFNQSLSLFVNYEFSNLNVLMDDVDITQTAYQNNAVNIPNVTGDVFISSDLTPISGYLIPSSIDFQGNSYNNKGYKNGYALTAGTGYETAYASGVVTGLIPFVVPKNGVGNPLYIKGVKIVQGDTMERMAFVSAKDMERKATFFFNDCSKFFTLEELEENHYKLTMNLYTDNEKNMLYVNQKLTDIYYYVGFSFIGTGENLIISNEPIGESEINYSITRNLTGVTSDSNINTVQQGSEHTESLNLYSGYSMDNIVVTMGGVDITETVYTEGIINIPQVTGNIVITANATFKSVTFKLTADQYVNNRQLATSTGAVGTATVTGYTVLGMIDIFGHGKTDYPITVTVKGVSINRTKYEKCYICFYDENGQFIQAHSCKPSNTFDYVGCTVTADESNDDIVSLTYNGKGTQFNPRYLKMTAYGSGENAEFTIT